MSGQAEYEYDVFISYNSSHRDWVRKNVQRWLEGVGLKVLVDYRDFPIGAFKINNFDQAVANSRHTVVVITRNWAQDEWAQRGGLLAGASDPAGLERRLIPLLVEDCELPPRIGDLEPADFTVREKWGIERVRLFRSVAAEQYLVDEHNVCEVVGGLNVLSRLSEYPLVLKILKDFRFDLRISSERFRSLSHYKAVHRRLHALQYWCHDFLITVEQHFFGVGKEKYFFDTKDILIKLISCKRTLENARNELEVLIGHPDFAECDTSWIEELGLIGQELRSVVETAEQEWQGVMRNGSSGAVVGCATGFGQNVSGQIKYTARWLDHVIGLPMVSTNKCLRETASALRLSEFVRTMRHLYRRLVQFDLGCAELGRILDCIDGLVGLEQQLRVLVDAQNKFQDVNSSLRMCQSCLHSHRHGLEEAWESVSKKSNSLYKYCSFMNLRNLKSYSDKIEDAINKSSYSIFEELFVPYRGEADFHFYKADEALNEMCEALVRIDEPLDAVVAKLGGVEDGERSVRSSR